MKSKIGVILLILYLGSIIVTSLYSVSRCLDAGYTDSVVTYNWKVYCTTTVPNRAVPLKLIEQDRRKTE